MEHTKTAIEKMRVLKRDITIIKCKMKIAISEVKKYLHCVDCVQVTQMKGIYKLNK